MSGASYNINDPAFRGYMIDRDERPGIEIGAQAVERAVSIDRRNPEGDYHPKDASVGDVQPRLLWPNILSQRPIPSRAPAWAATVTAAYKDPKRSTNGGAPAGLATFKNPDGSSPFGFFGAQAGRPSGIAVTGSSTPLGLQPGSVSGGTVSGSSTKSGQLVSGGAGQPEHVRPIRDRGGAEDDRYEHIIAPDRPLWSSRLPKGWTGAVLCTSREEAQSEVFIPGAHALVAGSHPDADPALTTAIVGTDPKTDFVDPSRRALFGDFARVVKDPYGITGANAVSWVLTNAHTKNIPEAAGLVTDLDPGDGLATSIRGAAVPVVHGVVSSQRGGFLDVGPSTRRHRAGGDADGNTVTQAGISTHALFRVPGSTVLDGHLVFADRQKIGEVEAPNVTRAHIVWDGSVPGVAGRVGVVGRGAWIIQAEAVLETEGGPPPDDPGDGRIPTPDPGAPTPPAPPPGGGTQPPAPPSPRLPTPDELIEIIRRESGQPAQPQPFPVKKKSIPSADELIRIIEEETARRRGKRRVGPTRLEDQNKAIGTTALETAFSSILFRPVTFACGESDLRNELRPTAEARARRKKDPVVAKLIAAWAKAGSSCNRGIPSYTTMPGRGPYPGGTAPGILMGLPPEVGPEDYATNYAPGGIARSSWVFGLLKGAVDFGSGVPNPTTGLLESGNKFRTATASTAAEIVSTTSAGAEDKTRTLPNRTGSIVLAPSALTSGQLVQADANGDLVPAGSGGSVSYAGIKFSNGTINRTLNTDSYTIDSLADNLYTLCFDLATYGYANGWTLSGETDNTLDCSAFTADQLAMAVQYLAADVAVGGTFIPSDYTVMNRQHVFYLDCDSYTMNQLGYALAALLNFMGA